MTKDTFCMQLSCSLADDGYMGQDGAGWKCLAMMSKGAARDMCFLGVGKGIEQRLVCVERNRSFSGHSGEMTGWGVPGSVWPIPSLMASCTTRCRFAAYYVHGGSVGLLQRWAWGAGRKSHTVPLDLLAPLSWVQSVLAPSLGNGQRAARVGSVSAEWLTSCGTPALAEWYMVNMPS